MKPMYTVTSDLGYKIPMDMMQFPSGEVNVKLQVSPGSQLPFKKYIEVTVQGYDKDTLFILACIKDALDDLLLRSGMKCEIYLCIPYLPNARYDRHMIDGDGYALKVFASMINLIKFDRIMTVDAHSEMACALIQNMVSLPQHVLMTAMLGQFKPDYDALVAPDAGAAKKIYKLSQAANKPVVVMGKSRDPATGKITQTTLADSSILLKDKRVLIVDDICDGGRTFIEAAKVLRRLGVADVQLAVSHGIFSAGVDNLIDNGISHIYTTNSFEAWDTKALADVSVYNLF